MSLCRQDGNRIIKAIISWGKPNFRKYPWRITSNRFHAIIAEVMLQRTKAQQVQTVYNNFITKFENPTDVCKNPSTAKEILKPLGLNWRTKKIVDLSTVLMKKEKIPDSFEELILLPGIGQYAASAFLSFHCNQRFPLIDANTVRVWGRVFGFKTDNETRRKKFFKELANKMTPETNFRDFNYALLDLGNLICRIDPFCEKCPINQMCCYNNRKKQI
jgi:A/G-specific adenine glycosylase